MIDLLPISAAARGARRLAGAVRRALPLLGAMIGGQLVVALLLAITVASMPRVERLGDRFQVALPLMALACSASPQAAGELVVRFAGMLVVAHGTKAALGRGGINERPRGGGSGMPSAHTAAASFGASALAQDCLRHSPAGRAAVILAAGFTGGSRIEAGAHDIWQVSAGAMLGWGSERLARRDGPLRRALARGFAAARGSVRPWRRRARIGLRQAARSGSRIGARMAARG